MPDNATLQRLFRKQLLELSLRREHNQWITDPLHFLFAEPPPPRLRWHYNAFQPCVINVSPPSVEQHDQWINYIETLKAYVKKHAKSEPPMPPAAQFYCHLVQYLHEKFPDSEPREVPWSHTIDCWAPRPDRFRRQLNHLWRLLDLHQQPLSWPVICPHRTQLVPSPVMYQQRECHFCHRCRTVLFRVLWLDAKAGRPLWKD